MVYWLGWDGLKNSYIKFSDYYVIFLKKILKTWADFSEHKNMC